PTQHYGQAGAHERIIVDEQHSDRRIGRLGHDGQGSRAVSRHPPSASGPYSSSPSATRTRSARPSSPYPGPGAWPALAGAVGAVLVTATSRPVPAAPLTATVTAAPGARLRTLVTASCTIR